MCNIPDYDNVTVTNTSRINELNDFILEVEAYMPLLIKAKPVYERKVNLCKNIKQHQIKYSRVVRPRNRAREIRSKAV